MVNEPSLAAIFQSALAQAPVSSVLHMAGAPDVFAVIEQIRTVRGEVRGDFAVVVRRWGTTD